MSKALLNQSHLLPDGVVPEISTRAKRLSLKLHPASGTVRMIIPQGCSERKALAFVEQHKDWIADKLGNLPPSLPFAHGSIIPIMGEMRRLHVEPHKKRTTEFDLREDTLIIRTSRDDPSNNIKRYLQGLARDCLSDMADDKAQRIGKTISDITLRDPKSRWGSCTHDQRLMFSWRLIFTPIDVMDYVVAHEVAHMEHMDHSSKFWALCQELSHNFAVGRPWLSQHGSSLMRIGVQPR